MGSKAARRQRLAGLVLAATLLGSGCIGAVERDELDQIVADRGGGVSNEMIADVISEIGDDYGVTAFEFATLSMRPNGLTIRVIDPAGTGQTDSYVFANSELVQKRPDDTEDLAELDLLPSTVLAEIDFESIIDQAFVDAGFDGQLQSMVVFTAPDDQVTISVSVENERESASLTYDQNGKRVG